ncbi:MAG: hypothetical protein K0R00_186 [Herbinix sp.]|jgi:hypothetical protein|nr:hypothetical protein [Herbinix sp.]
MKHLGNINAPAGVTGNVTGNSDTATKLKTPRTIALSGGATGTATSFDGSSNITIPITNIDPGYIGSGYTKSKFYIDTHPENAGTIIPFINNDIAFLLKKGGSASIYYDGVLQSLDISNVFDGSPSYWAINPSGVTEISIELTLHKTFGWTNTLYVAFGAAGWRSTNIIFDAMNTNNGETEWTNKSTVSSNSLGEYFLTFSHNGGTGFNKIRLTFSGWATATIFRIAQIGVINYGSEGLKETFISRGGSSIYGNLYPHTNNAYSLGDSSHLWSNGYFNTLTIGDSAKIPNLNADKLEGMEPSITNTGNTVVQRDSSGNFSAGTISAALSGNALTSTKLITPRNIALSGDVSGNVNFDGSSNVSISATVADDSHNHVISNIDNLQSALDAKTPFSTLSATTPATAQWYRIAASAVNIGANSGLFKVEFSGTGVKGRCLFVASCHDGVAAGSAINQLGFTTTSGTLGLTQIRVVYHTTATANYAYVEVYNPTALAITYTVDLIDSTGWALTVPSTLGSIPTGYTNESLVLDTGMVSMEDVTANRQLISKVATGTAPLVVSSTTVVPNLNASMVSGFTVGKSVPSNAVFTDTVYTHPTTPGNKHIPSGGAANQVLKYSADGTAVWGTDNDTVYTHPAHTVQSVSLDASGAEVIDVLAIASDALGHITSLSASKRTLTLANLGYTGATNANYFTYTLPVATSGALGGVKSGTDITVDASGNVSVVDDSHNHVISNIDNLQNTLNAKAPFATLSAATPATAQWYRIATSAVNIGANSGLFKVEFSGAGVKGRCLFIASCHDGVAAGSAINQLGFTTTNGTLGLTQARVVYHTTATANYAYVEVYNPTALAITYTVDLIDSTGWTLVTPSTAGSVPAGYTNESLVFDTGMVSMEDVTANRQLVSKVATGTAPLVVSSTTVVPNLNASMVSGFTVGKSVPSTAVFTDTVYTHPTTSGNKHIPSGGASGQVLKYSADGTAVWGTDNDTVTTINGKTGAIAKADITALGIPAQDTVYTHPTTSGNKHIPSGGAVNQVLKYSADGTAAWGDVIANNADSVDGYHFGDRTIWKTLNSIDAVIGQLGWKHYGNGHTIFDASNSTSPTGVAVNNKDSALAWEPTYPSLMGWNGSATYGLRVDSARKADTSVYSERASRIGNWEACAYVVAPTGGNRTSHTSPETGYIKITLPVSWTDTMMKITIDVFNYALNKNFTAIVSGYNYTGGVWTNCNASIISNEIASNLPVRFGHDGTKCAIYIGYADSSWAYPQIIVKDALLGFNVSSLATWESGWAVGITPTLGTISGEALSPLVGAKQIQTTIPTSLANGVVCYVYE